MLDRHNFTIMTRYISSTDNLKLMMNMLKEKSRNIQFEAFHVFKVSHPFYSDVILTSAEVMFFMVVCVSVSVCLISQKLSVDFGEIFWRGGAWPEEQLIRFLW